MTTIKDVARHAQVSVATVSRALNGVATVDEALARRVHESAEQLGYRGNRVARSLRRRQTEVWALIISDIGNPFFTAIARGVEDVAQERGFSIFLCNTDEDPAKEARYLEVAERSLVSGVLLSPNQAGSDISRLEQAGIPVVAIDRSLQEPTDQVLVDSSDGARTATRHLLDQGWVRPACVTGPAEADTARRRMRGYLTAMSEAGLADASDLVRMTNYRAEGGRAAVADLLDLATPPDALFVANSELALGAMEELAARGLQLGRDLGLVGFDDPPWAQFVNPPLSVVAQPAYDIGVTAARLLLDRLEPDSGSGPKQLRQVLLNANLIVRESSLRHR